MIFIGLNVFLQKLVEVVLVNGLAKSIIPNIQTANLAFLKHYEKS